MVSAGSGIVSNAVVDGRPFRPRAKKKPGTQRGAPSIVLPLNPNSRLGRLRSPLAQGGVQMETVVGIDVSKDRLDVCFYPSGEAFVVSRDAEGLDGLILRLGPLLPTAIGVEATGGCFSIW